MQISYDTVIKFIKSTSLFIFLIALAAPASATTVLFDEAHGQRFFIGSNGDLDLSKFANLFLDESREVYSTKLPFTTKLLQNVEVVVISGAFKAFSQSELATLQQFVLRGGNLIVMLHVGPMNGPLLQAFNVSVSNGVVRDPEHQLIDDSGNFETDAIASHPSTEGVAAMRFYGAWAMRTQGPQIYTIAHSSNNAWIDLNRNKQHDEGEPRGAWPLALGGKLGKGNYVFFGDDAMFQNRFLTGPNLTAAKQLIKWLYGQNQNN